MKQEMLTIITGSYKASWSLTECCHYFFVWVKTGQFWLLNPSSCILHKTKIIFHTILIKFPKKLLLLYDLAAFFTMKLQYWYEQHVMLVWTALSFQTLTNSGLDIHQSYNSHIITEESVSQQMVVSRVEPQKGIKVQAKARLEERHPFLQTCAYF